VSFAEATPKCTPAVIALLSVSIGRWRTMLHPAAGSNHGRDLLCPSDTDPGPSQLSAGPRLHIARTRSMACLTSLRGGDLVTDVGDGDVHALACRVRHGGSPGITDARVQKQKPRRVAGVVVLITADA
jgi:hypothetical protein